MTTEIDDETTFETSDDVVVEEIEGEAVLLDLAGDTYYSLNRVGHFIWSEIDEGAAFGEVVEEICANFDVEESTAREDAVGFLEHVVAEELATAEAS